MARVSGGILGNFNGKVGPVVGTNWKGIQVVKQYQPNVANPRTTGQVGQRNKFTGCVAMAKALLTTIVKPLNDRFAVKQSGYNVVVARNAKFFGTNGNVATPLSLIFSEGELGNQLGEQATVDVATQAVGIQWDMELSGKQLATDIAYMVLFNSTKGTFQGFNSGEPRSENEAIVTGSGVENGDVCYIYLMFRSADGTKVGNTFAIQANVG